MQAALGSVQRSPLVIAFPLVQQCYMTVMNAGYDPGLEVKSISINNEIYDWNDLCCVGEFNTRQIDFASDDDLSYFRYCNRCGSSLTQIKTCRVAWIATEL